jgi:hypothetical protein
MDHEISSSPASSLLASTSSDKDKNEAEPKKTTNVLLKVSGKVKVVHLNIKTCDGPRMGAHGSFKLL